MRSIQLLFQLNCFELPPERNLGLDLPDHSNPMNAFKPFSLTVAAIIGLLALCSPQSQAAGYKPKVGIQTWTLRKLNFDQMVDFCVKHQLKEDRKSTGLNSSHE